MCALNRGDAVGPLGLLDDVEVRLERGSLRCPWGWGGALFRHRLLWFYVGSCVASKKPTRESRTNAKRHVGDHFEE